MARFHQPMSINEVISVNDLQQPIVFVIDMVNGFVKEGVLHDKAIQTIIPSIQKMLEKLQCRTIFVADSHPPMAKEFQAFPPHCMIGTSESEIVDELKKYVHEVICKNSTNTFLAPDFQTFLKERMNDYQDVILCGCCSDICVMQFALCLQAYIHEHNLSQRVIVCTDLMETYHIEHVHDAYEYNRIAVELMKASGVLVISNIVGGDLSC